MIPFRENRRSKRQPLTREHVVRTALALLDEVGLDDVTMRRLAERLDVKAASLYRHVKDKDELLVLLADEICGELPIVPARGTWQHQVSELAQHLRRGLLKHRDGARLLAATAPMGPRRLKQIDNVLRILLSSGLSDVDAAQAAHHLNNFITEFVADEGRFAAAAEAMGVTRRKMGAEIRKHFASLPRDEYPNIVRLADPLSDVNPDALFAFGVDVWVRGIQSHLRK